MKCLPTSSSREHCFRGARFSNKLLSWCAPIVLQRPASSSAHKIHSRLTLCASLDVSRFTQSVQLTKAFPRLTAGELGAKSARVELLLVCVSDMSDTGKGPAQSLQQASQSNQDEYESFASSRQCAGVTKRHRQLGCRASVSTEYNGVCSSLLACGAVIGYIHVQRQKYTPYYEL